MSRSLINSNPTLDLTARIVRLGDQFCDGGSFGDVYRCKYRSDSGLKEVAVKALRFKIGLEEREGIGGDKWVKMVKRELGIWRRLRHKNVVPFLGTATGFGLSGSVALVSLWMSHGTLQKFLEGHDDKLAIAHRFELLLGIAEGLLYLHTFPIIHGDLNSNNVLIDETFTACLADFGYTSVVGEIEKNLAYLQVSKHRPGAVRWAAPEQFPEDPEMPWQPTPLTDIYSFGNIVLQVLSGEQPWSETQNDVVVMFNLAKGINPGRPQSRLIDNEHWEFIERCWLPVQGRPSAIDIVPELQRFLDTSHHLRLPLREHLVSSPHKQSQPASAETSNLKGAPADIPIVPRLAQLGVSPAGKAGATRKRKRQVDDIENSLRTTTFVPVSNTSHGHPILSATDHYSPSLGPGRTPEFPAPAALRSFWAPRPPLPPSAHVPYPPSPEHPPQAGPIEQSSSASTSLAPVTNTSNWDQFPDDLDPQHVPPEFKKEGSDWFAVFNPKVKRVLDVNLVHTLMHESVVCCVRFSADGKFLATGCNRTAQIYDTKTGAKTCVLADDYAGKAGDLYIRSVCFSPDGKYLATGAEDKQIRIWDIAKKRIRNVFDGHQQEVYSLDFSLDGRLLVSGSIDNTARIWDMVDGSSKVLRDPKMSDSYAGVNSVAISPNGQLVAVGVLGDDVVCIWDVASGVLIERLRGHRNSIFSVAFTPDGKGLVSGSLDKTLNYWDVSGLINGAKWKDAAANGKKELEKASQCTMNFIGHRDYVLSVAVSHNGQWVVSGSKDRGVRFWDSHTATVQCILQGHTNSVMSIDMSPVGSMLATGSGDCQARISI